MEIFGEEYGFLLTIGASAAVAELCPDGDLSRIEEVLDENKPSQVINFTAHLCEAMAKGFDDAKRFSGEQVTHRPLTAEMVLALSRDDFKDVQDAAIAAFKANTETTVEVAPSKKKESQAKK